MRHARTPKFQFSGPTVHSLYCASSVLDQVSASVEDEVNFLTELYQVGSSYSTLNTASSALSTIWWFLG